MAVDDGHAVHYLEVGAGTPVYDSLEAEVGKVTEVLDNAREGIFDGIVVKRGDGVDVFVDAPEVARTAERGVTLAITGAELEQYEPHKRGGLGRFFGR